MTKNELNDAYFNWMIFKEIIVSKAFKRAASNRIYLQYSDGWKSGGRWSGFKVSVWL